MGVKTIKETNSTYLQAALNVVGEGLPYQILELEDGIYKIDAPLKMNSGTIIRAKRPGSKSVVFELMDHAPRSKFPGDPDGNIVPILGQKESRIHDIEISDIQFNGNRENQDVPHGKNYHNFVFLQYATNVNVHNIEVYHSLGDGVRVRNSTNIIFKDSVCNECGHDFFHGRNSKFITISNLKVRLCINSAVRVVNCNKVKISNIDASGFDHWSAGNPGIQVERSGNATDDGIKINDIEIYNCSFYKTYGAGIWIIDIGKYSADKTFTTGLYIHDCSFEKCGLNPLIDYVGGIVYSGWDGTRVERCSFIDNYGYGIVAMATTPSGTGFLLNAKYNIFSGTQKMRYKTSLKTGIAMCTLLDGHKIYGYGNKYSKNIGGNFKGNII